MNLIVIAHPLEAKAFTSIPETKADPSIPNLYRNPDWFLFISGSPVEGALPRLKTIIAELTPEPENIINLGCAGSLNDNLKLGEIHQVKKTLLENDLGVSQDVICLENENGIDCITANKGITTTARRKKLQEHGDITDLELFHLAGFCKEIKIPLKSYKYLSDRAGEDTDLSLIKKNGPEISGKLADFYKNL